MKDLINVSSNARDLLNTDDEHFIVKFLKTRNSKDTRRNYDVDIRQFFNVNRVEEITIEDILSINIIHVVNWVNKMKEEGKAAATIGRKVSSLSSLYIWLRRIQDNRTGFQLIKFNPFENVVEKPKIHNKETPFLTKEECNRVLNSLDTKTLLGLRNKAILSLALTTGLRESEIINIKIGDIMMYKGYRVLYAIRKGNKEDYIKLRDSVFNLIVQYVARTNRTFNDKDSILFKGHSTNNLNAEKLNPKSLRRMIKSVCKKANIEHDVVFHSTRHTAITLVAQKKDITIQQLKDFANHEDVNTTMKYVHKNDKLSNYAGDVIDIDI